MVIGDWRHASVEPIHLATTSPDRAAELLSRSFPGIRLSAPAAGPEFAFAFDRTGDTRLAVSRLRVTGEAVGEGSIGELVAVARLRGGRFALEYGRTGIDTSMPYLRPPGRSRARLQDAHVQLLALDPHEFAAAAHIRLEGSGRSLRAPSADAAGPMTPALLPSWARISDVVVATAFDDAAFGAPLVRAGLFDLVVSGLLATFALTAETGVAARYGAGPAAVRRAVAYIDEHLAEPFDVGAIAVAARMPVRTLQTAFRAQMGVAPMEHVRRRRLAAAREDLLAADPSLGDTVADIAHRWGFVHLARFAEQYRRVYDERPSDTLRR